MCGILGIGYYHDGVLSELKAKAVRHVATALLKGSQIRGSSAAGILSMTKTKAAMFKDGVPAKQLVERDKYQKVLEKTVFANSTFKCIIGHTRAQTKGSYLYNCNNHPIQSGSIIGVHNGTISNDDRLFETMELGERHGVVDSEVIFSLINKFRAAGKSLVLSVQKAHEVLRGGYACAFVDTNNSRYLNIFREGKWSPIIVYRYEAGGFYVFASEEIILRRATEGNDAGCLQHCYATEKMEIKNEGVRLDLYEKGATFKYNLEMNHTGVTGI